MMLHYRQCFDTQVILLVSTLMVYASNGAVLIWSNNNLEITPLNDFTDASLEDLIEKLGYPELTIYKSTTALVPLFEDILDGYHTAYNPNGYVNTENATEISEQEDLAFLVSKQRMDLSRNDNVLSVLVLPNGRYKRDVGIDSSTTETAATSSQGPVLYRAKSKKDIYSLLYSSQPLIIRNFTANSTTEVGESRSVTVDTPKNHYTRLYIKVQEENNVDQLMVQFFFVKEKTYWTLKSAKVGSTANINSTVSLTTSDTFSVPPRFSYHCNGETVFSDAAKSIELVIYDLQAQMESKDGRFSDAYDCVDFTTVPIWSGIFVTALLGFGLVIALLAINEIKTMDKFDNQKTKQLAITLAE